jgi:proteasome activator subunit 4
MAVDGEVREPTPANARVKDGKLPQQSGYIAGSKALDSLDRLITSIESFFHPSNTGMWTLSVRLNHIAFWRPYPFATFL